MHVKKGDKVKIHFTVKTDNGEIVESSASASPPEFTIGEGKALPGLEKGLIGMKSGESKTINVPVNEAYGPREERKVFEFGRDRMPEGFDPHVGQVIQMHAVDGTTFMVTVVGITENGCKMDANHPLAGKDLIYDVELVEIVG